MSESTKAALAASIAAGYFLGRRRNTKLAMALAAYLASKKLKSGPQGLLAMGAERLGGSPQVSQLVEQLRGEVLTVGRQALKAAADRRLGSFADSLADRTKSLNDLLETAQPDGEEGQEAEGAEEAGEEEGGEEEGGEEAEGREETEKERGRARTQERPARPRRPRHGEAREERAPARRTAEKAPGGPAKKAAKKTAKKAPPKKAAKKAAKKSAAHKPPAEPSPRRR